MQDIKNILGIIASILVLVGPVLYLRGVFANRVKPHAFTWLVWGATLATGFGIQVAAHAGAGAWSTGVGAISCGIIFLLALKKSDSTFSTFDWACLIGAGLSFTFWRIVHQPTIAAILLSLTDVLGFLPTFQKGYRLPFEDGITPFTYGGIGTVCAIAALGQFSLATWLYPVTMVVGNTAFVAMILYRRNATATQTAR